MSQGSHHLTSQNVDDNYLTCTGSTAPGESGDLEWKEDDKAMTKQMQHRTLKNTEKRPYVYSHDSAQPSTNTTKPYDYENFSFIYIFYYSYYMYFNMPIILLPILPNLPMRHEPT